MADFADIPVEESIITSEPSSPTKAPSSAASSPKAASSAPETENVGVMIRIRPFSKTELTLGDVDSNGSPTGKKGQDGEKKKVSSIVYVKDDTVVSILDPLAIESGAVKESFVYDRVFWSMTAEQGQPSLNTEFATQETVFQHVGLPCCEAVLKGRNSCVFAYGQTGSGKTHTMIGAPGDKGLIPRVINHLFSNGGNRLPSYIERTIQASFLEIYNEKVKDLLEAHALSEKGVKSTQGFADRKVRYNPEMGTYIDGLRRTPVNTPEECDAVITAGTSTRTVASTQMNDTSSRSHAILQLHIKQKDTHMGVIRTSILNLVDLAGSERIKMSGVSGQQLSEAKNINLSLTTLRRVIDTLLENAKNPKAKKVAPYRESMLTWVLSDSLGGNCRTTMLGTCSPHARNFEDTVNTLRYALKAKAISCTVKVNEEKCTVVVNALKSEMELLKKQLKDDGGEDSPGSSRGLNADRERDMQDKEDKAQADAKAQMEAKEQLRRQVTKSQVALKKAQSVLFKKQELADQTKILEEELAKAAEFKAKADKMMEEDKELEVLFQKEIEEATKLEKEIEGIEALQVVREAEALAAKAKEQKDTAALLFRCATRFGKDRQQMALLRRRIEKQNEKEEQLNQHHARILGKVDRAYEDLDKLRDCVHTGEMRVREQEKDTHDCVELRTDRIKTMFNYLYATRNKTKQLKTEESAKVEAEIKEHYDVLLPVHLDVVEKATKDARVTEKKLQGDELVLNRDIANLNRQIKSLETPCQTANQLIEESETTTSELQLIAVDQTQSILVLERQIQVVEEENAKLDADNAVTGQELWDSVEKLEEASVIMGVDAPNHTALKTLLKQDTAATAGGPGSSAGGDDGQPMELYRNCSSIGVLSNGGSDTPRGGHSRTTIQHVLRRTGMNFSCASGQEEAVSSVWDGGSTTRSGTSRHSGNAAVPDSPLMNGSSKPPQQKSSVGNSKFSRAASTSSRRSVSPNVAHTPGPLTRRLLRQDSRSPMV